jgi:O-antigen/teichoic acid export membrane protein
MDRTTARPQSSFLHSVRKTATLNLATTTVSAITGVVLARWLGPTGRGDYAAVTAYFGLALVFFEVGLGSSVVFYVSKAPRAAADYVYTAAGMLVPLAFVAALASVLLGLTVFGDSPGRRAAFLVIPFSIVLGFAGAPASFALQSLDMAKWNMTRLSQPAIFGLLVVATHSMRTLDISLVIGLMTVSLAVQAVLSWCLYLRVSSRRGEFQRKAIGPMLYFGALNMSSSAPYSLNSRVDQLVLAVMVSSAALGQYAVAVSLSVLAGPLVMAFGNVAFPRLARGERVAETIRLATRGSLLISVSSVAVILVLGPFAVPVLFGPGYHPVIRLLLILAPGAAAVVVNQVLGDILRGLGQPGTVAVCEWLGVLATVGGLALLVPGLGVTGAALTSTVTYIFVFILLRASVSRHAGPGSMRGGDNAAMDASGREIEDHPCA